MGHESHKYFRLIHFMNPEKAVTAKACISWVMKLLMAHEIPMKWWPIMDIKTQLFILGNLNGKTYYFRFGVLYSYL